MIVEVIYEVCDTVCNDTLEAHRITAQTLLSGVTIVTLIDIGNNSLETVIYKNAYRVHRKER